MANPSKFTLEARSEVEGYLKKKAYRIAVLHVGMYLQTRLGTLIRRSLDIKHESGRKKFNSVFDSQTLGTLLYLAHRAGMITGSEKDKLQKVTELRNDVAHDLELWGDLKETTKGAINYWCAWAMGFMESTDNRTKPVRKTRKGKPGYLDYP